MKRLAIIFFIVQLYPAVSQSQTFYKPNYALKSHETLEISKVEITAAQTVINLMIENRIEGGKFCADKNIYLIDSEGEKLNLLESAGIPVCPDSYNFKSVGEKLNFMLTFPPLKEGTKWIDVIENCSSNCFWFYGVTLDNDLNIKLDEVFSLAEEGEPANNILLFKTILDSIDKQDLGIEGLLYINIINAAFENADKINAIVWYRRLASSHAPRKDQYIKYLNDKGIKY